MLALLAMFALAQDATDEATTLWIAGEAPVPARRFVDGEADQKVDPGAEGEVLYREGELVRLKIGTRFVWVAKSATTTEAPAQGGGLSLEEALRFGEGMKLGTP